MATFYPNEPGSATPSSELRVWEALKDLPSPWVVLHSVVWQSLRHGRQADGEADFLLLHPGVGLVVLEVKGGRIVIENGQWFSVDRWDRTHRIKNPYIQAKDSKYALIQHLKDSRTRSSDVWISHGVVFPDVSIDESLGPAGSRQITWDSKDLLHVQDSLHRLVDHWGTRVPMERATFDQVVQDLAPTTELRIQLSAQVAESRQALIRLTDQQQAAFRQLRLVRRAVVVGGAGTGKTVLALGRARQYAQEGFRTLLTCYNAPLCQHLKQELTDVGQVDIQTFHSLCLSELRASGKTDIQPSSNWWEQLAAEDLIAAVEKTGTSYDAIVVDEGQDFRPSWLTALMLLLREPDDSPMFVFADSHQEIYARHAELPPDWPKLVLDMNCRNTEPIASRVRSVFGDESGSLSAPGAEPIFEVVDMKRSGEPLVQRIVGRMLTEGALLPEQVVVLSDSRPFVDRLRETMSVGHPFVAIGETGIVAETVHRFKGLEADVVVLVISDNLLTSPDVLRPLAYVGMSRSRTRLFVLGSRQVKRLLDW